MEKQTSLVKELAQLNPLVGRWTFKGSFKDNSDKIVEGWETYKVVNEGSALLCDGETITFWSGDKDIYKNTFSIVYDNEKKEIVGDVDWVLSINKGMFSIQNNRHRFTGEINESNDTITGKWENKDASGKWKYWYDKVLTRTAGRQNIEEQ